MKQKLAPSHQALLWACMSVSALNLVAMSSPRAFAQVASRIPLLVQATTPGTQQTGNANLSGTLIAGSFVGRGSGLTNVDADRLGGLTSTSYGRVSGTNSWTGANHFSNAGSSFAGDGQLLTNLNAGSLANGFIPDARISVGGDLSGPVSNLLVEGLQGRAVNPVAPDPGDVLGFNNGQWLPRTDNVTLPLTKTQSASNSLLVLWNTGSGRALDLLSAGSAGLSVKNGVNDATATFENEALNRTVQIGSTLGAIHTDGYVYRNYGSTRAAAIPVAYGNISSTGGPTGGTFNYMIQKSVVGTYDVTIDNEIFSSSFIVVVTPNSSSARFATVTDAGTPFRVTMRDSAGTLTDTGFMFIVYRTLPSDGP